MEWHSCSLNPLPWIDLRETLLTLFFTPALLLSLLVFLMLMAAWVLHTPPLPAAVAALMVSLAASALYSPIATGILSGWLFQLVPPPPPSLASSKKPVVVVVGRGPAIADATTRAAAEHWRRGDALAAYVSGDQLATAQRLQALGIPDNRLAGDSCARTTWENATRTASWLRQHHPGAPVLLITDPWQLARASRSFGKQGLVVIPESATPSLDPHSRNQLALRETAAIVLYTLQGRI